MINPLLDALAARPLLLDGGMGTRLMARGLDLSVDDPAFWNLAHPEIVGEIHGLDVAAGSDAILTNTFGANPAWLARFGRAGEMAAINRRAVALARDAAGPDRFVLGSIGPTAAETARAQAEVLADSGVDGLLFETHDAEQALVALAALRPAFDLPILVSLIALPEGAIDRLIGAGADVLGFNCVHPSRAVELIASLSGRVDLSLFAKPGAFHPEGPAIAPYELAATVPELLGRGVRLFGGCCGATEAHVASLRSALDEATADLV